MKKIYLVGVTFGISILFNLIIYMCLGIVPFGNNTLMIWDMQWQYSSFFAWFHNVLLGYADWKYSFIGGFGGNNMGLISYYLSSPLNIILIFFNAKTMPWGILLITLLKSGFMASTMQFYLNKKREDFFSVLFGCMYALSSYVICYQSNIMWMDGIILLPVIIYGLEELIEKNNGTIYSIMLGLAIVCNWYIGYMICLFCAVYFIIFLLVKKCDLKIFHRFKILSRFILYSLLAGGGAAFIILPTIYNLLLSSNKHMSTVEALLEQSKLFEYEQSLQFLMAGSFNKQQGILGDMPLIYCGIFPVFLVIMFFVSAKYSKGTKIFYGLLMAAMCYSFNSQGLDLIWHGCYTPVGSPWRNAFFWTFLFLTTAYQGLSSIEKDNYKVILWSLGITIIYFIYMFLLHGYKKLSLGNFIIIICFLVLYFCYTNYKSKRIIFFSLLFAVAICCAELSYNALKVHNVQYANGYEQLSDYRKKITTINKLLGYVTKKESPESLYRTEILEYASRNYNDGYLYNVNTLNMYTSTEKQATWDLFSNLGWGYPKQNARYDNNVTMLSRNLSGVKYFITSGIYTDEYEFIAKMDKYYLYRNPWSLPLGFVVNTSALNIKNEPPSNLFEYQNALYHSLIGSSKEDIYTVVSDTNIVENIDVSDRIIELENGNYTDGKKVYAENVQLLKKTIITCRENTLLLESSRDSQIYGRFLNPTDSNIYVCFTIPYEEAWEVKVDGEKCEKTTGMGGFLLVPIEPGEHNVELNYHVPYLGIGICITLGCMTGLLVLENKRKSSGNN